MHAYTIRLFRLGTMQRDARDYMTLKSAEDESKCNKKKKKRNETHGIGDLCAFVAVRVLQKRGRASVTE